MGKEQDIKQGNRKYLIAYMLLNYFLFGWVSNLFLLTLNDLENLADKAISPANLLGLLIIPLCVVLEAIISSDLKHQLVFLRLKYPLPGSRAFSEIAPRDHRIDMGSIGKLFPDGVPNDPKAQNSAWYSLYKKHFNKMRVIQAHRSFLLTRDIASLTMLFIPASFIAHVIWETATYGIWIHMAILVLILSVTILSCQNYGKRFVANVLVEEL